MDVYMAKFWSRLPTVINEIADAEYVAVDFEMTGIEPRKQARLQQPTMEEVYQRAKSAAETFNIVQFGLTCVRFDKKQGKFGYMGDPTDDMWCGAYNTDCYVSSAYNFIVSPLFQTENGATKQLARMVDRTLVISYSTMLFLRSNRIRLEDSYLDGIPYLSRTEEAEIKPQFLMQETDQGRKLVDLQTKDAETQEFYNDIREKLQLWEKTPDDGEYLNIANPHGGRLNRLQRLLVFQLLETEFPNKYFAAVKGDYFMQILKDVDPEEEERRKVKLKERSDALMSQRGLRYIIEALVGGDFAEDVALLVDPKGKVPSENDTDTTIWSRLYASQKKLKSQPPVLVGHNMLYDLCFLYQNFIGPLPENINGFSREIHTLFPRLVDTKHLVTQGKHDMAANDNLEELYNEAAKQKNPIILHTTPVEYNRLNKSRPHHAGFDSSMTAVLFLKQAYAMAQADAKKSASQSNQRPLPESIFPQAYANRIRIGNAGILHFDAAEEELKSLSISPTD